MKTDREFWHSGRMNNYTYVQYYNRLVELSISMFKWKGLPDTVDERFLELCLFAQGKALFFFDENLGYLCLRCTIGGGFNVYRVPLLRNAIADNGYTAKRGIKDSVIIWNNRLRTPSMLAVRNYSERLYNMDRVIDVNVNAQKTPILIQGSESQMLTLKNVYQKYDGNEPVIFADKNYDNNSVSVVTTGAPYIADKIVTLKTETWNDALTYLGINNINITKKERLLNDEVKRNAAGVIASRMSRLRAREQACDEINRMFGLNISCEYVDDLEPLRELEQSLEKGGDDDE